MTAEYSKHTLQFKRPSGTSRGVLQQKESWFIILKENGAVGIGECGLLKGLSVDDVPDYEEKLADLCERINRGEEPAPVEYADYPSIRFGLEMALLSLRSEDPFELFHSEFTRGKLPIPINGLVWMGDEDFMKEQINQKIEQGFGCIKMKIGAIDFETEFKLLEAIRRSFTAEQIELRVDANGAFSEEEALSNLKRLATLDLHSIEQPIKAGNWQAMAALCEVTPLPIALDEELIGIHDMAEKEQLIQTVSPQFIILKPSLVGGIQACDEWIELAEKYGAGWWITSALESNVGLNAISQYTFTKNSTLPQGLGTGGLYTNNVEAPLVVKQGNLWYEPQLSWNLSSLGVTI